MKNAWVLLSLLVCTQLLTSTNAHSAPCAESTRSFSGEPAKKLIQALMFAGVMQDNVGFGKSPLDDGSKSFHMDTIYCDQEPQTHDGIERFGCRNPNVVDNAVGKVFVDAISSLGVASYIAKNETHYDLKNLACAVTVSINGPSYQCSVEAFWTSDCR